MQTRSRLRHVHLAAICTAGMAIGAGSTAQAGSDAWVGLEDMAQLLRDDARMVVLGDSYSVSWFFRVPPACLRVWPLTRITAMEGGPKQYHDLMRALALSNQVSAVESGDPDGLGYTVERQEPEPTYFALPVRGMREFHANEDMVLGYGNRLLEFRIQNYRFDPGVHGPFSNTGDNVRFRMLYRCTSDPGKQLPSVSLQDYYGGLVSMDLLGNARGFLHLGEAWLQVPFSENCRGDQGFVGLGLESGYPFTSIA